MKKNINFLIVDDSETIIMGLKVLINKNYPNAKIFESTNIEKAYDIFQIEKIDILLLDIYFYASKQSGIDLFLKLKAIQNNLKTIAITSYSSKFAFECGKIGIDDFIEKTFKEEILISKINNQIRAIENDYVGNVFCIMPFSKELYDTYLFGIKDTFNKYGYKCERIDEQHYNDLIISKIKKSIKKADIIIAELTGQNQNVYYEVGFAHALNKKVILIADNIDDVKFDLKSNNIIIYDKKIHVLKERLEAEIKNILS